MGYGGKAVYGRGFEGCVDEEGVVVAYEGLEFFESVFWIAFEPSNQHWNKK